MIVQLEYYKPSGKFYTSAEFEVSDDMLFHHVVAKVRGWAFNGGQGALPGLGSGEWFGYIRILACGEPRIIDATDVARSTANRRHPK